MGVIFENESESFNTSETKGKYICWAKACLEIPLASDLTPQECMDLVKSVTVCQNGVYLLSDNHVNLLNRVLPATNTEVSSRSVSIQLRAIHPFFARFTESSKSSGDYIFHFNIPDRAGPCRITYNEEVYGPDEYTLDSFTCYDVYPDIFESCQEPGDYKVNVSTATCHPKYLWITNPSAINNVIAYLDNTPQISNLVEQNVNWIRIPINLGPYSNPYISRSTQLSFTKTSDEPMDSVVIIERHVSRLFW